MGGHVSLRTWSVVVAVWLLSLAAVAAVAQSRVITPLAEPVILSGSDIAFRVEAEQGSRPVGKLLVRYNGRWIEPKSAPGTLNLASR
jgi:hypothetical protein